MTAAGKTELALELVRRHPRVEIVNADSLLVYRGMDVGTAKPTRAERASARHHLIDLRDPDEPFTVADFTRLALAAIDEIHGRGGRTLVVGGTGFYLEALTRGLWPAPPTDAALREKLEAHESPRLYEQLEKLDPASATLIGPTDRYRLVRALEIVETSGLRPSDLRREQLAKGPDPRFRLWVVDRPDAELRDRIRHRTRAMLEAGLVEEVRRLQASYPGARVLRAIGYAQTLAHLENRSPRGRAVRAGLDGLADEIQLATRRLVKGQRTWFRPKTAIRRFLLDAERTLLLDSFEEVYGE